MIAKIGLKKGIDMGKLIVIEGLDGSGKTTQTKLLCDELVSRGLNVRMLSYPRYDTTSGQLVSEYLHGALGSDAMETNAYAVSDLFAIDRYISYVKEWRDFYGDTNAVVVTTRYTTANAIHQLAKLPREEWDGFLRWIYDLEYVKFGIPEPDMVLFLEMKPEISFELIKKRAEKSGEKPDIHETDLELIKRFYKAGVYSAEKLGWERIVCHDGREPLPEADITSMILEKATVCLTVNKPAESRLKNLLG